MAKPYLISYDLNKSDKDYNSLYKVIKECSNGAWAHILESVWLIKSNLDATTIYNELMDVIDSNDKLFIVEMTSNYFGYLNKDMWPYLKDNIF